MLTRAKIAYDLTNSPYKKNIDYGNSVITYHFSSELYMNKFESRRDDHRKTIEGSLYNRFGFHIKSALIADLRMYSAIEKRGYLISVNGEYIKCQNNITLDGLKLITNN